MTSIATLALTASALAFVTLWKFYFVIYSIPHIVPSSFFFLSLSTSALRSKNGSVVTTSLP